VVSFIFLPYAQGEFRSRKRFLDDIWEPGGAGATIGGLVSPRCEGFSDLTLIISYLPDCYSGRG